LHPPPLPPCSTAPARDTARAGAGLTDGRGLFFGGGIELFFIQLLALLVSMLWSVCLTWLIVEGLQRAGVQLRPPEGHEEHGIDFVSHGER
jgi:ammonia channel protein AmtB